MRKLLRYLRHYKKESIIGPLFKLLEACFELIVPLVMANIIDIGIKNQDMPYIWKMGAVLVLFGVLGLACSLTAQYFAAKAAVGFGTELRHDLFAHINSLSYAEIDQAGSATLVTRMTSDINQVQSGGIASVFTISVYCGGSNDHGFYNQCESCPDFCGGSTASCNCDLWNYDDHDSVI